MFIEGIGSPESYNIILRQQVRGNTFSVSTRCFKERTCGRRSDLRYIGIGNGTVRLLILIFDSYKMVYEKEAFYCDECGTEHDCGEEMMLPVLNSPRMGVCG